MFPRPRGDQTRGPRGARRHPISPAPTPTPHTPPSPTRPKMEGQRSPPTNRQIHQPQGPGHYSACDVTCLQARAVSEPQPPLVTPRWTDPCGAVRACLEAWLRTLQSSLWPCGGNTELRRPRTTSCKTSRLLLRALSGVTGRYRPNFPSNLGHCHVEASPPQK